MKQSREKLWSRAVWAPRNGALLLQTLQFQLLMLLKMILKTNAQPAKPSKAKSGAVRFFKGNDKIDNEPRNTPAMSGLGSNIQPSKSCQNKEF